MINEAESESEEGLEMKRKLALARDSRARNARIIPRLFLLTRRPRETSANDLIGWRHSSAIDARFSLREV